MIVFNLYIPYTLNYSRQNWIKDIFACHATDLTHDIAFRASINHAGNNQGTGCFFKNLRFTPSVGACPEWAQLDNLTGTLRVALDCYFSKNKY